MKIVIIEDYQSSKKTIVQTSTIETIQLPKSNVIKFHLEDGSWFTVRPSGTEPKVKFYFSVNGNSLRNSENILSTLETNVMNLVDQLIKT